MRRTAAGAAYIAVPSPPPPPPRPLKTTTTKDATSGLACSSFPAATLATGPAATAAAAA